MDDSRDLLRYSELLGTNRREGASAESARATTPLTGASGAPSEPHVGVHALILGLDAASPTWQRDWKTIRDAAAAYGLLAEYEDYMRLYGAIMRGVPDYGAENERRRAERAAEVAMASRARGLSARGTAE